ncbi:MAG: UbiX family flavin prenyltransferase, partial [Peptococcaceae bacterium]|nr:UbiX family flavin prenyltransferase [Peptococcaceae bacterium]
MQKIVVGITGASGAIYGIRLLQVLQEMGVETHLVVSPTGQKVIKFETGYDRAGLQSLAHWHDVADLFAPIASGSFLATAMVIAPCSMHSLAGVAQGITDNLLLRSADVMLKEG